MNAGNGNTRTRNDEEEDEDVIFQEIATNQSEVTVLYFRCIIMIGMIVFIIPVLYWNQ